MWALQTLYSISTTSESGTRKIKWKEMGFALCDNYYCVYRTENTLTRFFESRKVFPTARNSKQFFTSIMCVYNIYVRFHTNFSILSNMNDETTSTKEFRTNFPIGLPECVGQTDRQTGGHILRHHNSPHSAVSIASRGKNVTRWET